MDELLREQIPHAPQMGLFVAPDIPESRLSNALADYAHHVSPEEVVALYDATLTGNAKDGAVFAVDRFIFQNTDLEAPQTVRYRDLDSLELKQRWFGIAGKRIELSLRRGQTTFTLTMDFSGQPEAADYVATFLEAALDHDPEAAAPQDAASEETPDHTPEETATGAETDVDAVRTALRRLRDDGKLAAADYERLLEVLEG